MTNSALPRPRQVTLAAWMIMTGSFLVVLTVFDRMIGINTLDTREAIEAFLAEPPGDGLGLSVPAVQTLIRVFTMIAGACAAAAVILGYHVLQRHRGARLALSVIAVPLFLTGLVAGGFLSSLVAAAALMLWLEPSRDWFAGRPARQPVQRDRTPEKPQLPPSPPPPSEPRAQQGFGTPGSAPVPSDPVPSDGESSDPVPYDPARYAAAYPAAYDPAGWGSPPRPTATVAAAVVTWVFAGLTGLLMAAAALLMLASPDLMFEEMYRQRPELAEQAATSEQSLRVTIVVLAAITVAWAVAASVAAIVLVLRRRAWARVALLVSAAVAGLFCLLGVATGAVLMIAPLAGCAVTFSLLLRRDVRSWVSAP